MKKAFGLLLLALLCVSLSAESVFAQKAPKGKTVPKIAKGKKEAASGSQKGLQNQKRDQDIVLDAIKIEYRVQTPRVKFNIERMPIDVTTDQSRFGDISKEVESRARQTLFSNKITEKPLQASPREVVNRERN